MKKIKIFGISIVIAVMFALIYKFFIYNDELVSADEIATDPEFENITYDKEENILEDDVLGILTIDKIGLKATVKDGSNNQILKEYIGAY